MTERAHCVAIYPGSFDPITRGHEDIVRRALLFSDCVIVAVAHTATQRKSELFDVDERLELIREVFQDEPRIIPTGFTGLLVDFARAQGARIIVRGLRAVSDFEYEFQMALMNRHLNAEMETVFMMPRLDLTYVSSSLVREIARFQGETTDLVNPMVHRALRERFPAT